MIRARLCYGGAAAALIAIGLLTRLPLLDLPRDIAKPLGSILWGAMVYCIVRWAWPQTRLLASAATAAAVAAAVEFSQLWHTQTLDAFRCTMIGVLLIGRYFAVSDILAYIVGIVIACGIDCAVTASLARR